MRYFSAQYVFTNDGPPLQRPIVCTDDDGKIISIEETGGNLSERHSVEFYNGIIIPGLINCHCHLEFSYLREVPMKEPGLAGFLEGITLNRNNREADRAGTMAEADRLMASEGVVACADICNTSATFELKKKSRIRYISLLEVYGFDAEKASVRIGEILSLSKEASEMDLTYYIVPHSVYSVSNPLFRHIKNLAAKNRVSSIHFLESEDEKSFLKDHSGPLMNAYLKILAPEGVMDPPPDHLNAISELVSRSGNLILVHNTAIEQFHITELMKRENLWYCLCPNSNLYISKKLPPVSLLSENSCEMVIGTDSLASNSRLSMLSEMITLQHNFPGVTLENIVKWATINGAMALGEDHWAGSITPGKNPGLVLISGCNLADMKLLPASSATRLI